MNAQQKKVFRWISTVALYVLSTIGLTAGIGATLSYGISGVTADAFTINQETALFLGILIGLVIQWIETDFYLHPEDMTEVERFFVPTLLLVDVLMIFVALGGHLNVLWMLQNGDDTAGMIVHTLGLVGQLIGALLGSFGAELSLKKAMGLQTTGLFQHLFGKKARVNASLHQQR